MRKDGRPLVTDYPVTAMDMIDYTPPSELPPIPAGEGYRRDVDTSWMDEGIAPDEDDESLWIP